MAHPITLATSFGYLLLSKYLEINKTEKVYIDKIYSAFRGDFWQKGLETLLPSSSGTVLSEQLKNRYVPRNVIQEGVSRVSSAFLGRNPEWQYVVDGQAVNLAALKSQYAALQKQQQLVARRNAAIKNIADNTPPTIPDGNGNSVPNPSLTTAVGPVAPLPTQDENNAEASLMKDLEDQIKQNDFLDEMDKLLSEYWTYMGLGEIMVKAFEARLTASRGGIRIYIPRKYIADGTFKTVNTIQDALKIIQVEYVEPGQAKMLKDDGEYFSIAMFSKVINWDTDQRDNFIEFSFIDDAGKTFIGLYQQNPSSQALTLPGVEVKTPNLPPGPGLPKAGTPNLTEGIDLDKNTTYYEMQGDPYVTEPVFKQNQLMNLALTCLGFNVVDNGFGEMVLTNVDLETQKVPDPDSETGYRDVPKRIRRGAGVVNNFVGLEKLDMTTGKSDFSTPGVHFKDPTSAQTFIDSYNMAYSAALEEMGQKYALISGDATTSGEARIQAMVDFYLKIRKYKSEVDRLGSWLITVLLKLAAKMAGSTQEKQFEKVSSVFSSKLKIGQLAAPDKQIVLSMQTQGIISKDTARVLLEVDDPKLEEELIQKEGDKAAMQTPVAQVPVNNQNPNPNPVPPTNGN